MKTVSKTFVAVLLLAISVVNVQAATETITLVSDGAGGYKLQAEHSALVSIEYISGTEDPDFTSTYVNFPLGKNEEMAVYVTIPTNWKVSAVTFNGVAYSGLSSLTFDAGGEPFTVPTFASSMTFTPTNATYVSASELTLIVKAGNSANNYFQFSSIVITYEEGAAGPLFTYPDGCNGGNTAENASTPVPYQYDAIPTSYTITSDKQLYYVHQGRLQAVTSSNISTAFVEIWDEDMNNLEAVSSVQINAAGTELTVNIAAGKLQNCGEYISVIGVTLFNSDSIRYNSLSSDWYFRTPQETITLEGKTTFYKGEVFSDDMWVIRVDGVDKTDECTYEPPLTTSTGTRTVTIEHGACTKKIEYTVREANSYTITWTNNITGEELAASSVTEGNTIGTLPTPTQTTVETECGTKKFVGWSATEINTPTNTPTLVSASFVPTADATFYAVYANANASAAGNQWALVTNTAELEAQVGKQILIAASASNMVLGAPSSSGKNFAAVTGTLDNVNNTITVPSGATPVKLEQVGTHYTLQLVSNDYLYAASSSSNYLKTRSDNSDGDSEWAITISNGVATIVAQGSNTRNKLMYNATSTLFSAYSSTASQTEVCIYRASGVEGSITTCSCTKLNAPTGLTAPEVGAQGAALRWNSVTNAHHYTIYYKQQGTATWQKVDTTYSTTISISGLTKLTTYDWKVEANGTGNYCDNATEQQATSSFNTTSECRLQLELKNGENWEIYDCFTQVGTTTEWQLPYTLPAGSQHVRVVGNGSYNAANQTQDWQFDWVNFGSLQGTCTNYFPGEGAIGKLRIYSDASTERSNYYLGFLPTYIMRSRIDGNAESWTNQEFAWVNGNNYETADVVIPEGYASYTYWVGPKSNATAGANFINDKSSNDNLNSMNGLNAAGDHTGVVGKYHIYDNSCDNNWYCEFKPYHYVIYYKADRETELARTAYIPTDTLLTSALRQITLPMAGEVRSGYRLVGWTHEKEYEGDVVRAEDYAVGAAFTISEPAYKLYPIYKKEVNLIYNTNSGNAASFTCENVVVEAGGTAILCGAEPTWNNYKFLGWATTANEVADETRYAAGDSYTVGTEDVTLYARWMPYVTITYDQTDVTFNGDCELSYQRVKGDVITFCAEPTSTRGWTFLGWTITGHTDTLAVGSMMTVSGNYLNVVIRAAWDTPAYEYTFFNEGNNDVGTPIATMVGHEGICLTTPTSCGVVPVNCDGKVFVGWLHGHYDGALDGAQGINSAEELVNTVKTNLHKYPSLIEDNDNYDAESVEFVEPGECIYPSIKNQGYWFAVFAVPE